MNKKQASEPSAKVKSPERPLIVMAACVLLVVAIMAVYFPMTRLVSSEMDTKDIATRLENLELKSLSSVENVSSNNNEPHLKEIDRLSESILRKDEENALRNKALDNRIRDLQSQIESLKQDIAHLSGKEAVRIEKNGTRIRPNPLDMKKKLANDRGKPQMRYHVVGKNDTFYSISQSYNLSLETLRALNHFDEKTKIYPGQRIIVGP